MNVAGEVQDLFRKTTTDSLDKLESLLSLLAINEEFLIKEKVIKPI